MRGTLTVDEDAGQLGRSPSCLAAEARETSGLTSALLLGYLDHRGGHDAVARVLARCDLSDCEAELRDEDTWFSWETKIALFEAAAAELDDPRFLGDMASYSLDAKIAGPIKLAVRALGSPQLVLRNVVSANARFVRSHRLEMLELQDGHAVLRFSEIGSRGRYHRLDCQYTGGLLAIVPELFGLPRATVSHHECATHGASACLFEMHWTRSAGNRRRFAATVLGSAGALAAGALLLPPSAPLTALAGAASGAAIVSERRRADRQRIQHLRRQLIDSEQVAERLFAGQQEVFSDLRLDEVVAKVIRHAQTAVGGREFLLLVREGDQLVCRSSSDLPAPAIAAVERWSNRSAGLLDEPVLLDDITRATDLAELAGAEMPLRSLASAPLRSRTGGLGVLVALGGQIGNFLPHDVSVLGSYATQVAIALDNARLYQNERSLAASDPLTGFGPQHSFHETLDAELLRCRADLCHGSVVLLDLDRFKSVNDEDGHAAGDRLLQAVGRAISQAARRDDLAFRIGGDEFALLLPRVDEEEARGVADRACDAIAALDPRVGASAGVASVGPADEDKQALLARADARLYESKRGQRRRERLSTSEARHVAEAAAEALLQAIALHHGENAEHASVVAALAGAVAARLGLSDRDRRLVARAASLHDVGMLAVPRAILDKPRRLTDAEWKIVRRHPDDGARTLAGIDALASLAPLVRASHERWDGQGYPLGLAGEAIPLAARIIAACEAFDAMIADRPYRAARTHAAAIAELEACAGSQFDPAVVAALIAELRAAPAASALVG